MARLKEFLRKKDVVFTLQRYGIDALGAMAQGLFCTLLVGTILNTIGQQFGIGFLNEIIVTIGSGEGASAYTIGGLASAITGPLATCLFKLEMNGAAVSSGMGTCGFVGQIGVYTGWVNDVAITTMDWVGLALICFVLPAVLSWVFCEVLRKWGWIGEKDLKLDL